MRLKNMLWLLIACPGLVAFRDPIKITNNKLEILVNNEMQMMVKNAAPGARPLMKNFSNSEYLITDLFIAENFKLISSNQSDIDSKNGRGVEWILIGKYEGYPLEKIVRVTTWESFPDVAYFQVNYLNKGKKILTLKKWINNQYDVIPSQNDTTHFWSFQGSTHADRRDWIQKVNPGLIHKNFMGMNESDYGGGIPVIDLWRKDAGIAVGMTDPVFRLVSLPVNYDRYADGATINVNYEFDNKETLNPQDSIKTFETFVSVHTGDCFSTLRNYSDYMKTKGIHAARPEPESFETMWCAWGYERNFTVKEILATLPKVKELGIKWVGLDDGFFPEIGDWYTTETKFPGGDEDMKAFVDSIHAYGLKAMIWWNPMAVSPLSQYIKDHPSSILIQKNGAPQYVTWWDSFYPSPTDSTVINSTIATVLRFIEGWGFDGLKLDGQNQNLCSPDYGEGHNITNPNQSFEQLPNLFKEILVNTQEIKPDAVVQICPCGTVMNFYMMPYTNQFVASDPESPWQVRTKALVYHALMPGTAYYGDHVELIGDDFASQFGVGGVPGTKFVWPQLGSTTEKKLLLTPEKELIYKKWIVLYNEMMLSKGDYLGNLYDIGYDYPETHSIEKDGNLYYAFFNPDFKGEVRLRGLNADKKYQVTDYFNNISYGIISGEKGNLKVNFKHSLLLKTTPVN